MRRVERNTSNQHNSGYHVKYSKRARRTDSDYVIIIFWGIRLGVLIWGSSMVYCGTS